MASHTAAADIHMERNTAITTGTIKRRSDETNGRTDTYAHVNTRFQHSLSHSAYKKQIDGEQTNKNAMLESRK